MEYKEFLPMLSCFAIPGITWFLLKRITLSVDGDVKELKEKFSELREDLPKIYVLKGDFNTAVAGINDMLMMIYNILERRKNSKE